MALKSGLNIGRKKAKATKLPKGYDTKYLGDEPTWEGVESVSEVEIAKALSWYAYFDDANARLKMFLDSVAEDDRPALLGLEKNSLKPSVAFTARMISRGCPFPQDHLDRYEDAINELKELVAERGSEARDPNDPKGYRPPGSERVVHSLEKKLDEFFDAGYVGEFNAYDWFTANAKFVKPGHMPDVQRRYEPLLEELDHAIDKTDPDVVEGYRNVRRDQIRNYRAFVAGIIEDSKRFGQNVKKSRVARAPKPVSVEKILKGLRYQKDDQGLKVVSVDPAKLLGATRLLVFNTKNRMLLMYVAAPGQKLGIHGSRITGFDETLSTQKKLRRPETQLKDLANSPLKSTVKLYDELTTTAQRLNGSTTRTSILLRAFDKE